MTEYMFGQLPENWSLLKLPEIAAKEKHSIKRGPFGSAIKKEFFVLQGFKVYQQQNVIYNDFNYGDYFIDAARFRELEGFKVRTGDVLMTCSGTVGKVAVVPESAKEGIINQALLKISPDNRIISTSFFTYLFRHIISRIMAESTRGSAMLNLNSVQDLKSIGFPIPPLPEQHRIVAKIEELFTQLDAGVELLQKTKVLLNQYRQSVLKAAFEGKLTEEWRGKNDRATSDWKFVPLGEISCLISGQHIMQSDYNEEGRGIPYLTGPADFGDTYPTISKWTDKPKAIANRNGILITVKGAGVGKVNILGIEQAAISRQLMEIRLNNLNAKFFYHYLKSKFHELQKLGLGSTVPGIDRKSILGIKVPVVDIDEQNQVVQVIESHMSFIDAITTSIMTNIVRHR